MDDETSLCTDYPRVANGHLMIFDNNMRQPFGDLIIAATIGVVPGSIAIIEY